MDELIARLTECLGTTSVLTGADAWARMHPGSGGRALLLPRSTNDVCKALALCHTARCPVVPQGGLTGLVGGAVSGAGEIALSLERMRRIEEVDSVNRSMTVEAGVPLQAAQQAARDRGLLLALDIAARGTATIGGNVATNAGGTQVLRFGMMREMVLGLEAVLADGTIVDATTKMLKNNAGYDVKHLFIGSEGTLGVVTRVVLRLRPLPRSLTSALLAVDDFARVTSLLSLLEARLPGTLTSFEVMWRSFYEQMTTPPARGRAVLPHGHAHYVLIETVGGGEDEGEGRLTDVLSEAMAQNLVFDAVLARTAMQRRELWAIREDLAQLERDGPVFVYDVSLGLDAMDKYVADVTRGLASRLGEHRLFVYGHVGDGNLHLAVQAAAHVAQADIDAIVYDALPERQSSVSAEHGIGLLKKKELRRSRNEAEILLMRRLKQALDPRGILNRGKVFDANEVFEADTRPSRDGSAVEAPTFDLYTQQERLV